MKCECCDAEATVHISPFPHIEKRLDLCKPCADEVGVDEVNGFSAYEVACRVNGKKYPNSIAYTMSTTKS